MTQLEFIKLLEHKVNESSLSALVKFGLNICRRLLPDYVSFSVNHGWGDVELLREAIELCEASIKSALAEKNIEVTVYDF